MISDHFIRALGCAPEAAMYLRLMEHIMLGPLCVSLLLCLSPPHSCPTPLSHATQELWYGPFHSDHRDLIAGLTL